MKHQMTVFKDLQERHEHLLKLLESSGDILEEAGEYIVKVRKDSALVSSPEERDTLRANLRYWASYVYEYTGTYPNSDLAPALPPTLMSRIKKNRIWLLFIGLIIFLAIYLYANIQREAVVALSEEINNSLVIPSDLVFAGQVSDADGKWLNDYVVVLFINGEEVARTISSLQDSPLSGRGPMDGVFELSTPNIYRLSLSHGFFQEDGNLVPFQAVAGLYRISYIGTWFNLTPNSYRDIMVPEKQVQYSIVVLNQPVDELSEIYDQGALSFANGMVLINKADNVQFNILPNEPEGVTWNLQMTGFYGNRWNLWEKYISDHVPSLSWEVFRDSVLLYNPQLEEDGYIFYPDKTYLLPSSQ